MKYVVLTIAGIYFTYLLGKLLISISLYGISNGFKNWNESNGDSL